SDPPAVARLVTESRLQLRFGQPAIADEHLAELHLARRYHALRPPTASARGTWYLKLVTMRVAIAIATVTALGCGSKDREPQQVPAPPPFPIPQPAPQPA